MASKNNRKRQEAYSEQRLSLARVPEALRLAQGRVQELLVQRLPVDLVCLHKLSNQVNLTRTGKVNPYKLLFGI